MTTEPTITHATLDAAALGTAAILRAIADERRLWPIIKEDQP